MATSIQQKNKAAQILLALITLLLPSCACIFDPVRNADVPTSPGSAWTRQTINVKKTTENPFALTDLSQSMPLSLLLDMALYNNPATRASWNNARAAAYAHYASLSSYYPAITFTGSLNAQTNTGSTFANSASGIVSTSTPSPTAARNQSFSTNLSNELSMTYLLLDFGGRSASVDFTRQALYAADWQHNFTMQQIMLSVLNAYTAYLGNKALVAAYEQDLKDAEVALKAAQVMRLAGLATLTDVLLAQANVEQFRTSWLQAQGAENTSLGQVLIAVGLPPDTKVSLDQLPQKLPVIEISGNISELLELAKKRRPDLGIAIAAIKQQEDQLALSYSNSMPILTANANWNQIRFISPQKPPGYNEVAFLQVNFPIFEGFFFVNQQRQFRAQIEAAMANLDVQVAAVSTQVVTNYYALKSAEAAMPSSEAAVEYSARAFKGFVVQYKTGTASILEVLNALTLLSNARSQQILTRTQWASSLANLAFSVGVLEDTGGQWLEAPPEQLYHIPIREGHESEK